MFKKVLHKLIKQRGDCWAMLELIMFVLFFIIIYAIGLLLLRLILPDNGAESHVFAIPTGLGILTILLFTINTLFGIQLNFTNVGGTSVGVLIILGLIALARKVNFKDLRPKFQTPSLSFFEKIMLAAIAILIVLMFVHSVIVPINKYDAFLYHLPIAQETFLTGNFPSDITPSILSYEKAYPPLGYFAYSLFYIVEGTEDLLIAKLLPYIFGVLSMGVIYLLSRKILKRSNEEAIAGVLLGLAAYYFSNLFTSENTDIIMGFYFLGGVYFLVKHLQTNQARYLYVMTLMLAFSYWTKFVALAGILAVGLVIVWKIKSLNIRHVVGAGVIGGILILPHAIRNWILVGNPVYPAFGSIIGGKLLNEWTIGNIIERSQPIPFSQTPFDLFFRFAVLVVPFLVVWLMYYKKNLADKYVAYAVLIYFALWASLLRNPGLENTYRYMFAAVMLGAMLAAPVFMDFVKGGLKGRAKNVLFGLLAVSAAALALAFSNNFVNGFIRYFNEIELLVVLGVLLVMAAYIVVRIPGKLPVIGIIGVVLIPVTLSLLVQPIAFSKTGELGEDVAVSGFEPVGSWMAGNLGKTDVVLMLNNRKYLLSVNYFPADSVELMGIYTGAELDEAVMLLKKQEVSHILITEQFKTNPLWESSVVYQNIDSEQFSLVYSEDESARKSKIYAIN